MTVRMDSESQHIEVHKFYAGAVLGICFLALVLQAFLNRFSPRFGILELPLLVVVYFGLSRRNSVIGLLLGTAVGLLQDGVSHTPIGLYGIAKGFIGYIASSIGARLDTEHPISRFILMFLFFHIHQVLLALMIRLLLAQHAPFFTVHLLIASLLNSVIGVFLFAGLDRLRKQ
ncbi:MAG TPA: rod shape-determining protein MreD [Candidatus Acidoferrales bacterium]|nr:rod shape-determining protein MreD [Candidatus Acidoferrales bacterium]